MEEHICTLEKFYKDVEITVRGETILVKNVELFRCIYCGEELRKFQKGDRDILVEAYNKYLDNHPEVEKWWK